MAEEFSIDIRGIEQTIANINKLPRQIVAETFDDALQAAGNVIQAAVAAKTPVRVHVVIRGGARGGKVMELTLPRLITKIVAVVEIDDSLKYGRVRIGFGDLGYIARFVEFGHRIVHGGYSHIDKKGRSHGPGRESGEVIPHPFMREGLELSAKEAVDAFAVSLRNSAFMNRVQDFS